MARSHLTLAALATSAVAGADIVASRALSSSGAGRFDSAVVTLRSGEEYTVRVPTGPDAESEQSRDLVALNALTAGVRSRLPFHIPALIGQAPIGGTRALVYDYIQGRPATLADVGGEHSASDSIGRAIAAVHSLPTSVVSDAGLSSQSATQAAATAKKLAERAGATGKVPKELLTRWALAIDDSALWQFQPTVVHGSLAPESFLVSGDQVFGVLGWHELKVGDPALDLFWLNSAARAESADRVFAAYEGALGRPADRQLRKRARLYAELEIARWLLHGHDTRDQAIVADAEAMLAGLSSTVQNDLLNPLSTDTGQIMAVEDVEAMLDRTPLADRFGEGDRVAHANRIAED
ncbi:phosphotransferase [Herbiconiux moechotypicola]|uniref:Aminoglycoside phosphotransferase domain-containing protein n=1 Tax=Herbiconiux moechotypicola TaxID=637393 RepID=A0ABN3DNA2_9MICO|nr:phosphotransferase [Herbiconiux moechotypicola]MCS5730330.1 phosphotransferase [Herbiconiux moechotypicola]